MFDFFGQIETGVRQTLVEEDLRDDNHAGNDEGREVVVNNRVDNGKQAVDDEEQSVRDLLAAAKFLLISSVRKGLSNLVHCILSLCLDLLTLTGRFARIVLHDRILVEHVFVE